MIEISVPATTRALLTTAELRTAAGVTGGARDAELAAVGLTVADIICKWCKVRGDGIVPVTLRQETLIETFYPEYRCGSLLVLSRRFLGTVSLTEDDVALVENTDYTVDKGTGILTRRCDDRARSWGSSGLIVVTYQAGFATVPTDLADVAAEMVGRRAGSVRDPMMRRKSVEIPGVRTIAEDYWVDAADAVDITPDMASILANYRTPVVG